MTAYTDLKARLAAYAHDTACILCGCPVLELNVRDHATCCRCLEENPLDKKARALTYALAAIEELEARNHWQPIETAPKDGTVIYVWHVSPINRHAAFDVNIKKAQWITEAEEWRVEGVGGNVPPNLSHWRPLPQPPETANDK